MQEVAKIEIASVTQNIAISIDTAAAFMPKGFILSGAGIDIIVMKMIEPKSRPSFCLDPITYR